MISIAHGPAALSGLRAIAGEPAQLHAALVRAKK